MNNTLPMPTTRGANIRAEPDMEALAGAIRGASGLKILPTQPFGAPKPEEPPEALGAIAIESVMSEVQLAADALSGAGDALTQQVHRFVSETKSSADGFIAEARQLKEMTDKVAQAIENTLGKHRALAERVTARMAACSSLCDTVTKAADDLRRAMDEAEPVTMVNLTNSGPGGQPPSASFSQ